MNKKLRQGTISLFDEYRMKRYPNYSFRWEQMCKYIEIDPSRFICEGILYEVSEAAKKPRHYILTLDMLIASSIVEAEKDVRRNLMRQQSKYYLRLLNPRMQKINCDGKYGIRLVSDGLAQNFTCGSKSDMQKWYEAFKRVAVLENLEETYELKQFIGSGSSAIVSIGKKIGDSEQTYAVKSFPKKNYTEKVYSFVLHCDNAIENSNKCDSLSSTYET
eukprot:TRINITY_DN3557_c0_g1_i2.p2 TRINITY_DN3557_c0_g1~~TRINITY_DN3557_c0_g1_i2.p2  ORF type:complete len:218 (+),score=33.85 TRINITY_DN3557_c0_g1_i2:60-713(+)